MEANNDYIYIYIYIYIFFFEFEETSPSQKVHFVGPGEGVKPRLSQALTRSARPDSNSRPAVQISNPLSSRYAPWGHIYIYIYKNGHWNTMNNF